MKSKKYIFIVFLILFSSIIVACTNVKKHTIDNPPNSSYGKNEEEDDEDIIWNDEVLEIYSPVYNKTLDYAYELFKKENPGLSIKICWGDKDRSKFSKEQILNETVVPDIIVIDELDFTENEKEKYFLPIINKECDYNVLEVAREIDEYTIAARVQIPLLYVKQREYAGNNLFSNKEYADEFSSMSTEQLIQMLYLYYGTGLFEENGNINTGHLEELIEFTKLVKNNSVNGETNFDEEKMISYFLREKFPVMFHVCKGLEDIEMYLSAVKKMNGHAIFMEGVIPSCQLVINKNSTMQDKCLEFFDCIFSEQVQIIDCNDGFPVEKKVLEEWVNVYEKNDATVFEDDQGNIINLESITKEEISQLIKLLIEKDAIYYRNMDLLDTIIYETQKYIDGSKHIDDVLLSIQNEYAKLI